MQKTIIPPKLKKGDRIGLIAPAFTITKQQLQESLKKLNKFGFEGFHTDIVLKKHGYFAGTDKERAKELMDMFSDKNIDGIMSIRGGYGTSRISEMIDYNLIKANAKPLIGYSDITFLQNAIFKKTGLVTFHGLSGVCDFNDFSINAFKNVVCENFANYTFPYLREPETINIEDFDLYTINNGTAEGTLIGGNLCVLTSMIGTNFEPDFENKIVFLEDVGESVYRIDRMLTQMIQATNIHKASGIIFGTFKECKKHKQQSFTLKQVINNIIKPLKIPTSYGFSFGHIKHKITIPIGVNAYFNADDNILKLKI